MSDENLSAIEAFTEVLESVTMSLYATDKRTNMKQVATEVLSVLNQFGWGLKRDDEIGADELHRKAIAEAKDLLAKSISEHVRTGATSSMARALQGILVILIEQQENSGVVTVRETDDENTPNSVLWGGQGAKD